MFWNWDWNKGSKPVTIFFKCWGCWWKVTLSSIFALFCNIFGINQYLLTNLVKAKMMPPELKWRKLCIDCIKWRIWSVTSNILHLLGLQNLNYISSLSEACFEVWLGMRGVQTAYGGKRDVSQIDPLHCIGLCGNLCGTFQIDRAFKLCLTTHWRPITLHWTGSQL